MLIFMKLTCLPIILAFMVTLSACGGRVPTPKTAQNASLRYFKGYGRQFVATPFGSKNLSSVSIHQIEEVSYKIALADVALGFVDGHSGRALVTLQNKFPGGWRVISWEMLEYR